MSIQNLRNFNFEETKKNLIQYFMNLESVEWQLEKLKIQKGLTTNYDLSVNYKSTPYIKIGKDDFNMSAKEIKEEQLKEYLSSYYWANSMLSESEQLYIKECFINRKYEDEIIDSLGLTNNESLEFKNLKRSAIYKFADFLGFIVEKI